MWNEADSANLRDDMLARTKNRGPIPDFATMDPKGLLVALHFSAQLALRAMISMEATAMNATEYDEFAEHARRAGEMSEVLFDLLAKKLAGERLH
jgi:hypothetical protein